MDKDELVANDHNIELPPLAPVCHVLGMKTSSNVARKRADCRRALIKGQIETAQSLLDYLLSNETIDAEVYMLAGRLAAVQGDRVRELEMMRAAVGIEPANGEYLALLGRCYVRAQDIEAALVCVETALLCAPLTDLAYDALASVLSQLGRHGEAATLLRRATDAGSHNAAIYFNLGNNLKFSGDFAAARTAYEQATTLAPQYHKAHAALTSLGGITAQSNHLPKLEALIRETDDPKTLIHLRHAAAKECEALGHFDEAWHHLTTGKRALLSMMHTDPRVAIGALDELTATVRRWLPEASPDCRNDGPIFVVGMPRSGTTVVDRIISNHRDVTSIGESLYFAQQLKSACGSTSRDLLDVQMLRALDGSVNLAQIGSRYVAHGVEVSRGAPRFVDKFHLNFMLSGHLLRALPQARIICVIRDPLDTIVSNYRQLFEFDSALYAYSLDLAAATEFYIRFRRLAAVWKTLAPRRFYIVHYEALVTSPEAETASLLEFCGLDWQEGCSAIERNSASVATASAVQVRSKIHTDAIGNWWRYDKHLNDIRRRLAEEGMITPDGAVISDRETLGLTPSD